MNSSVPRARAKLLRFALSLPEAYEGFPWGERVAKVGKRVFVFFGRDGRGADLGLSVKLPASGADALDLPFTEPTGYGLGKHDWVSARFSPTDAVPVDLLETWILESYRAAAPRRLAERTASAGPARASGRSRSAPRAGRRSRSGPTR